MSQSLAKKNVSYIAVAALLPILFFPAIAIVANVFMDFIDYLSFPNFYPFVFAFFFVVIAAVVGIF
jgi:hypothetical protein